MTRSFQGHDHRTPDQHRPAVMALLSTCLAFPLRSRSSTHRLTQPATGADVLRTSCCGDLPNVSRAQLSLPKLLDTITTMEMYP